MLNIKRAGTARAFVETSPLFRPPVARNTSKQPFSKQVAEWLYKKNIQPIPVVRMAVDFFGLLYLRDVVARRPKPSEAWDNINGRKTLFYLKPEQNSWYRQVCDTADETLLFLDEFMFTYLCAATAGELRHGPSKGHVKKTKLETWRITIGGQVYERATTQRNFLEAMEPEKSLAYLKDAVALFNQDGWASSFGGKKWGAIAQTGLDRVTGKYEATIFVDRVFDLKHNGGPMFDKNSVINQDKLPGFLESKLYMNEDSSWSGWLAEGSKKLLALVSMARDIGLWQAPLPKITKGMAPSLLPAAKNAPELEVFDHVVSAAPSQSGAPDFPLPDLTCPKGKAHGYGIG